MLSRIKAIKNEIEKLESEKDEIWRKISPTTIERAHQLYSSLAASVPHAVCTVCQGYFENRSGVCPACNSTGFMSKQQYAMSIEETKAIRRNYANNLQRLSNSMP